MASYVAGDLVPSTFSGGLVLASVLVSYVGCQATVEILQRKGTSLSSWKSWVQIACCALSMGLVSVWCMHFIGNRAIVLGGGSLELQLVYHSSTTGYSLLLPILAFILIFSTAEWRPHAVWLQHVARVVLGVLAGAAIAGMHYVANSGVSNYELMPKTWAIALSCVVAVLDCFCVLAAFYNFRDKWISAPWRRILCAVVLAGGISAMHFIAATNCEYRLITLASPSQSRSMNSQVAIAGACCGVFVVGIACHIFIARWRDREQKKRSKKITLAWFCVDAVGRIAVTSEGVLPSRKITDKYPDSSLDDELDTNDDAFQWLFRLTRNWGCIDGIPRKMYSHVRSHRKDDGLESPPSSSQSSAIYDDDTYADSKILFEENAVVAASSLASALSLPLESMGVLSDKIYETGSLYDERTSRDIESGVFGRGKVLVLVKEASEAEVLTLLNTGLRFVGIEQVSRSIANAMRIPVSILESQILELKRYNENLQISDKDGTWLCFFAMLPKPHGKGFDIVVKKENHDQLPDVKLLDGPPQPWQQSLFNKLDGEKVSDLLKLLDDRTGKLRTLLMRDHQFTTTLKQVIVQLTAPFPETWVREARFWSRKLVAHYCNSRASMPTTTLFAFTVIGNINSPIDGSQALSRVPRRFFDARHRVYAGSPDHAIFAKNIHETFDPIFAKRKPKHDNSYIPKLPVSFPSNPFRRVTENSRDDGPTISPTPSAIALGGMPARTSISAGGGDQLRPSNPRNYTKMSGIHVQTDTTVRVNDMSDFLHDTLTIDTPMVRKVTISANFPERTFVDELTEITKERFTPAFKSSESAVF